VPTTPGPTGLMTDFGRVSKLYFEAPLDLLRDTMSNQGTVIANDGSAIAELKQGHTVTAMGLSDVTLNVSKLQDALHELSSAHAALKDALVKSDAKILLLEAQHREVFAHLARTDVNVGKSEQVTEQLVRHVGALEAEPPVVVVVQEPETKPSTEGIKSGTAGAEPRPHRRSS